MKKYIGPFISALIASLVITVSGLFYFIILKQIPGLGYVRFIFVAIVLVSVCVMAVVLIQRIRELKEGEEDDLGKY